MPVATRSARAAAAGSAAHAPAPITAATPQQTLSNSTNSGKKRKATVEPESSGPSVPAKKPKTNSKAKPVKREKEEVEKKTEKKSVAPEKVAAPKKKVIFHPRMYFRTVADTFKDPLCRDCCFSQTIPSLQA
ncbi:hypothetical protein BDZ45DRAFT_42994 [Acephala macrosclerotiorum]|nr:hypothetical protein BDZ45DRAFT_42994 [Acephala macrosclerotiorum]